MAGLILLAVVYRQLRNKATVFHHEANAIGHPAAVVKSEATGFRSTAPAAAAGGGEAGSLVLKIEGSSSCRHYCNSDIKLVGISDVVACSCSDSCIGSQNCCTDHGRWCGRSSAKSPAEPYAAGLGFPVYHNGPQTTALDAVLLVSLGSAPVSAVAGLLKWLRWLRYAGVGRFHVYDCKRYGSHTPVHPPPVAWLYNGL